jgi:hypothetical protein
VKGSSLEKSTAAEIVRAAVALDEMLGRLDGIVSAIPDMNERKAFATKLGNIIGLINDSLIRPIAKEFPELDPDT